MVIDEVELQRHQQLEKLYRSTRGARVKIVLPLIIDWNFIWFCSTLSFCFSGEVIILSF